MNVNVLQNTNPYNNNLTFVRNNTNASKIKTNFADTFNNVSNQKINPAKNTSNTTVASNISNKDIAAQNIAISQSELTFFQKLFPDNANQIANYVQFNRNGAIINTNPNKGSIIDAIS
jgi:hypothetical protein